LPARVGLAVAVTIAAVGALAIPGSAPAIVNTGELKVLVVLATWGPEPFTREQARRVVFEESDAFVRENSYGKAWLTGDVTPWLRAFERRPACSQVPLASAAQVAARAAGFDTAAYPRYIYAFAPLGCPYIGYGGFREVWLDGAMTRTLVTHELGHTFGLQHANMHDCSGVVCTETEYGDPFDTMGSGRGGYNAFERFQAGWLSNVRYARKNGEYVIDQHEQPSTKPQALAIQTARADYWLDHREPIGVDGIFAGRPLVTGVEVHGGPPATDPSVVSEFASANSLLPNPGGRGTPVLLPGHTFSVRGAFRASVLRHEGTSVAVRFAWTDSARPARPHVMLPKRAKRGKPVLVEWDRAGDGRGSGVARYEVRTDGRLAASVVEDFKVPAQARVRFRARGVHRVSVVAVDRAGNRSRTVVRPISVR
jgi:Gametolysin peptidase M11